MNTLLLGGNRFVGVEIAWQLLKAGHEVTILALDAPPAGLRPHVRWLKLDRNDEAALKAAFGRETFDAVVDNIAYEPQHVRTLIAALEGRTGRYMLTSTVDGFTHAHPRTWFEYEADIREFDLNDGQGEHYSRGKRSCEAVLKTTDLAWTVVRPAVVTGVRDNVRGAPGFRGIQWFEEAARSHFWPARIMDGGPILLHSEDECVFQLVWSVDLARAIVHLLGSESAVGQAYNAAADEIWTNERLVRALAQAAGASPEIVYAPGSVIEQAGMDFISPYGTSPMWSIVDNSKLKAAGWKPTPAEQWLPTLLEAQGEPNMRMWYHTRMQEIALAKRMQRHTAQQPRPTAAASAEFLSGKAGAASTLGGADMWLRLPGKLNPAASMAWRDKALAQKRKVVPRADFYRTFDGAAVSGIGMGTWMGELTAAMDQRYVETLAHGASRGLNVFDTAINYRSMRAERCVGRAIRRLAETGIPREAILVATKGGYITHDSEDGRAPGEFIRQEYLDTGLISADEMARSHSINPRFIEKQIERSLSNLGLETIDVYFLHNPEDLIVAVGEEAFLQTLSGTLAVLEKAVADGKIVRYGLATWDGLRVPPGDSKHLPLEKILAAASEAAAKQGHARHHLHVLQLPFNVRDDQAANVPSQPVQGRLLPAFEAAAVLGLYCFTSASVLQGAGVPDDTAQSLRNALAGFTTHSAALHSVRATTGVGTALVGMRRIESVEEAIAVASLPIGSMEVAAVEHAN